ncbi:MAG: hypothetical protein QNL12_10340, partial [Acidimicrobiia bacterium]|nr:hypothetical protein [Acidimicrobiia bacterium]MDX2467703.1 hypothetical protein [Acidimicrobiia bacterium]
MRRSILVMALAVAVVSGTAALATAADLDTSWGSGGTASFALPVGTTVNDTALLADGRVVAVGEQAGLMPWGGIVSADGATLTPLTGFAMPDTQFDAVATGNNQIYAIGEAGIGPGISTVV